MLLRGRSIAVELLSLFRRRNSFGGNGFRNRYLLRLFFLYPVGPAGVGSGGESDQKGERNPFYQLSSSGVSCGWGQCHWDHEMESCESDRRDRSLIAVWTGLPRRR